MKKMNYICILLLLFSTATYAQVIRFNDYDNDKDGYYDMDEFSLMYSRGYNDWDTDGDRRIDDGEFYMASFGNLDLDSDRNLNETEWMGGLKYVYRDYMASDTFADYDTNADGMISDKEFRESMSNRKYYKSYDLNGDNYISREELNKATFSSWDKNRDGRLDKDEFNMLSSYYIRINGME